MQQKIKNRIEKFNKQLKDCPFCKSEVYLEEAKHIYLQIICSDEECIMANGLNYYVQMIDEDAIEDMVNKFNYRGEDKLYSKGQLICYLLE